VPAFDLAAPIRCAQLRQAAVTIAIQTCDKRFGWSCNARGERMLVGALQAAVLAGSSFGEVGPEEFVCGQGVAPGTVTMPLQASVAGIAGL